MSLSALRELMVLGAIRDHPAHGYALAEALATSIGWTLGLTRATIYSILTRFEGRGWAESERSQVGRFPERQVFRLTDAGEAAYAVLLDGAASDGAEPMLPLAALLIHLDQLPEERRQQILDQVRQRRVEQLHTLDEVGPHEGAAGVALSLMADQLRSELEHIDRLAR